MDLAAPVRGQQHEVRVRLFRLAEDLAIRHAHTEDRAHFGPGVARAERALQSLELPEGQVERTVTDAGGYWVYMSPLKNKAEVDRKVRELRDLGVTEFFVVQDAGQWRNAISLGIFRTDEAAQAYLAKLKQRKVRSAIAARRENFLKQVAFYVREPSEATVARLTLIQQEFPGSEMKAGPCPPAQG